MNKEDIVQYDCRSGIDYMEIRELYGKVKARYPRSAEELWAWKMFDLGFAYGKRAERAKRKEIKYYE